MVVRNSINRSRGGIGCPFLRQGLLFHSNYHVYLDSRSMMCAYTLWRCQTTIIGYGVVSLTRKEPACPSRLPISLDTTTRFSKVGRDLHNQSWVRLHGPERNYRVRFEWSGPHPVYIVLVQRDNLHYLFPVERAVLRTVEEAFQTSPYVRIPPFRI